MPAQMSVQMSAQKQTQVQVQKQRSRVAGQGQRGSFGRRERAKRPSAHAPSGPFTCACRTSLATGDAEGQTSLKHRNKEGPSPSGGSDQNSQRGGCIKEPPARAHAALAGHSRPPAPSHTRLARRAPSLGRLGRRLACPKGVGSPCADRAVCAVAAVGRRLCGQ
jgi:hypothetical protein